MNKKNASILLFTLLILTVIIFLTTHLIRSVWVGDIFNRRMVAKEQARFLALGGINLAISQVLIQEDKSNKQEDEKTRELNAIKKMLSNTFVYLNRWQIFDIEEKFYGFQGQVKFCVTCENGKININQAFDFQKQEFKKEWQKRLSTLYIPGKFAEGEFLKKITEFLKKRKRKLDDISELVKMEGLGSLNMFYSPPSMPKTKREARPNSNIFLQDLFTVFTNDDKINLLFLSDSACAVLRVGRRPLATDPEVLKEKYDNFIKDFNINWTSDWEQHWNALVPFFGEKPSDLKELNQILSKEVGGKVYSVLSCGIVGDVEQKLLAIIKEFEIKSEDLGKEKNSPNKNEDQKKEKASREFKIIKIYWL
jgi:hypothetical protein